MHSVIANRLGCARVTEVIPAGAIVTLQGDRHRILVRFSYQQTLYWTYTRLLKVEESPIVVTGKLKRLK